MHTENVTNVINYIQNVPHSTPDSVELQGDELSG